MEPIETIVAVSLGVLAAVFLGTLAVLFILCYRRIANKQTTLFTVADFCPDTQLVMSKDADRGNQWSEFELDDVKLAPQIRRILNNTQWVDDANGLIPHSLGILKLCHQLTEQLTVSALAGNHKDRLHEMIQLSQRVSPQIDDVASAMYPPLDPRLLEARCCALVSSLHLLVCHARPAMPKALQPYIAEALSDMGKHLTVLRAASVSFETINRVFRDESPSPISND